jgi:hypothetical protein
MKNFELITKPNGEFLSLIRYAKTLVTITDIECCSTYYEIDSKKLNDVIYSLQESKHNFTTLTEVEYRSIQKNTLGIEPFLSFKINPTKK